MPQPLADMPSRYLNKIENTVQIACQFRLNAAAEELHMKIDTIPSAVTNCINIAVSFDSSWKTRGFYSNLGFGSAISATTKNVLDYVLLNRICEKCNRWNEKRIQENPDIYKLWFESHKQNCQKNFSGSSQSMEPEAAKIIWSRSISKHQLCYSTFIGDGDSKSYQQVVSMDPYPLVPIHKEECLAHVSKRVKKSLCRIKKNTKNKSYVQHKLPKPKAEYIASTFQLLFSSTVGNRQHKWLPDSISCYYTQVVTIHPVKLIPGADGDNLHPHVSHHLPVRTTTVKISRRYKRYSTISPQKISANT